jgi:hypothetical protein
MTARPEAGKHVAEANRHIDGATEHIEALASFL